MVKILAKTGNMEYRIQKQGNTLRFVQEDGIIILFDSVADPPALGEWAELPAPTKKVAYSGGFTDKFVVVEDDQLIDTADKKEGCFSTASMKGITNVMPVEEISSLNVYETNTRGYFYNTDGTACFICGKMR